MALELLDGEEVTRYTGGLILSFRVSELPCLQMVVSGMAVSAGMYVPKQIQTIGQRRSRVTSVATRKFLRI